MRSIAACLAILLCCVVGLANCDCTYTTSDGLYHYDLSALTHATGQPDLSFTDTAGNTFYLNVCGTTTAACTNDQAVCQQGANMKYYGCGALASQTFSDYPNGFTQSGVTIFYGNGTVCGGIGAPRQTTVYASCDTYAYYPVIDNVTEMDCSYFIYMRSQYACPISDDVKTCPDATTVYGALLQTDDITVGDVTGSGCWEAQRGNWYEITPSDDDTIVTSVCSDYPITISVVALTCDWDNTYDTSTCYNDIGEETYLSWCYRSYGYTAKIDAIEDQSYYVLVGTDSAIGWIEYDVNIYLEEMAKKLATITIVIIVLCTVIPCCCCCFCIAVCICLCVRSSSRSRRDGYVVVQQQLPPPPSSVVVPTMGYTPVYAQPAH